MKNGLPGSFASQLESAVTFRRGRVISLLGGSVSLDATVRVTCEQQHTWKTTAGFVLGGGWCPECTENEAKLSLVYQRIQSVVDKKQGKILTAKDEIRNLNAEVLFECANGHAWETKAARVIYGAWCMACRRTNQAHGIGVLKDAAKTHGGKLLSAKYVAAQSVYLWECKEGHRFELGFVYVKKGSWCQTCSPLKTTKKTIEQMRVLATERGGECLSESYEGNKTKLLWRCSAGHEWMTSPAVVQKGFWCPTCSLKARMASIHDLEALAKGRGGSCLSKEYVDVQTGYTWRCREGHEFKLSYTYAKKGAWCPVCERTEEQSEKLEQLNALAKARGGLCISSAYVDKESNLLWRCSKSHEWEARPGNIVKGTWCPTCALEGKRKGIEWAQEIARARGGKCLSHYYVSGREKLRFSCEKGHEWMAQPQAVARGTWCPVCSGKAPKTIEDMRALAASKCGKCLSSSYQPRAKLLWQCAKGHQWRAMYGNIQHGSSWCSLCSYGTLTYSELAALASKRGGKILSPPTDHRNGESVLRVKCKEGHAWNIRAAALTKGSWCRQCHANSLRVPIEEVRAYANSRGGKVLTEKLSASKGRSWVFFQCAEGHTWRAVGSDVLRNRSWCRRCHYDGMGHSLEEMQREAANRRGECLSRKYLGLRTKLTWRCQEGHAWSTTPAIVMGGSWCVKCTSPKLNSIEKVQAMVEAKGGRCLSERYLGSGVKLEFQCKKGHSWWTTPNCIQQGSWCHECTNTKHGDMEKMHDLARKQGGRCLSNEYVNNHTKLQWRCRKGHEFWMKPNHIASRNSWCPICRGKVKRTLADIQALAIERGGRCHSHTFTKNSDVIELECAEGHQWKTRAAGFIHGTWCPACAGNRPGTMGIAKISQLRTIETREGPL